MARPSGRSRASSPVVSEPASGPALTAHSIADLRRSLLAWYDRNRRDLPWRRTKDPYAIWISEIMLQQTRVAVVEERFKSFLRNFPTVEALAHAEEAEVLAEWSGMGYYRRARMLHKAAHAVVAERKGIMPKTAGDLRALPGIGAYTSAAVASIAYGEPIAVVDGNVERVIQRLAGWGADTASPAALTRITEQRAQAILDAKRPGDFNQAMMELGATVCLPRKPLCLSCPLNSLCQTRGEHPVAPRARMRSEDAAYALVIRSTSRNREVLLEQRSPEQTVMPGMWELPALRDVQVAGDQLRMVLRHAIMQVNYYVRIRTVVEQDADALTVPSQNRQWHRLYELGGIPLTGLTRKVLLRAHLPELAPNPQQLTSPSRAD